MRICIVSIAVLFSVPMVAASYPVAATTVTNDVIFTNPARSIHWKTVCSGNLEIPVPNWPDGASSATGFPPTGLPPDCIASMFPHPGML